MAKKILVVDDSALMRRVLCDIINSDTRFQVTDRAYNGLEALELLSKNTYDAVVLDVNMPKMDGIQLLRELRKRKISARIMMASTDTKEGAKVTMDALELGAMDFVHKPTNAVDCRLDVFQNTLLRTLAVVSIGKPPVFDGPEKELEIRKPIVPIMSAKRVPGRKIVAVASSTGGPRALQAVVPKLPVGLDAPVLIVQHMPQGFTASLADRLNTLSAVTVKEAAEGMELENGVVYIAKGGKHMNVATSPAGKYTIHLSDEPSREGVKPCANYMYESLMGSRFDNIVCVVMTGMGADGTEGIKNLKSRKKVHVITQDQESCTVYGMPKAAVNAGLSNKAVPLEQIAQEIILNVGVAN